MTTIVRLLNSPLLQVGGLVFDCELAAARGQDREYTRRRVAAGVTLSDHSRLLASEWDLDGAVSMFAQFQNIARPGADPLESLQAMALNAVLTVPFAGQAASTALEFSGALPSRLGDFEDSLRALIAVGDEVEVVTKAPGTGGRFRAVVLSWRASSSSQGPDSGGAATYRMRLLEVQRANALGLSEATLQALGLNGSGTMTGLGPTGSPANLVTLTP